ncbi:MAG: ComEC/Rec2 family competence protein [Flavobacteriales bacterium]|nr:ComEC/Rec2 family competence protein [Flavobacteriales bacterium]
MNDWNQLPLFRLIIPFILGVLTEIFFSIQFNFILIGVCISACMLLFSAWKNTFKWNFIFGASTYLIFYLLAILLTNTINPLNDKVHYSLFESKYYEVKLLEDIVEKPNSIKAEVEVKFCFVKGEKIQSSGKIILYFQKNSIAESLIYGDHILINTNLQEIDLPTNPSQFNYKQYLENNGIFHQAYLITDKWKKTNVNTGIWVKKLALKLRRDALDLLRNNSFSDKELSVASALLLGKKDLLDRETILTYSSSGAMHVLAVSGLHVGIIYLAFFYLFFFFDKWKYGKYIKAILLIIILWGYALFTGLSPSVLRAATMFSFIIIGGVLKRKTNIYNTLAASAFLLIILNPTIIMKVGFQLSYIAVIGIVYLQGKLYKLFYFRNWFLDKIWVITTVSIAAQIATFPLGMYYFHQFPNYFLLSNLFVIPLATLILNIALLLFSTAFVPLFSEYIAIVLRKLVELLNTSVIWVDSLPNSLTLGIDISFLECLFIYFFLIFFVISISNKKFRIIQFSVVLMTLFMSFQIKEMKEIYSQKMMVVYDIKDFTAIDFFDGEKCYFLSEVDLINDENKVRFNIQHHRWEKNIEDVIIVSKNIRVDNFRKHNDVTQFFSHTIFFPKSDVKFIDKTHFNFVIISKEFDYSLDNLFKEISSDLVILDSSLSFYKRKETLSFFKENGIKYYDVKERGAFVINLN